MPVNRFSETRVLDLKGNANPSFTAEPCAPDPIKHLNGFKSETPCTLAEPQNYATQTSDLDQDGTGSVQDKIEVYNSSPQLKHQVKSLS